MTAPEPDGIVWHTSSYSAGNGDCVEVGWHTSSYSASNGGCVEVGRHTDSDENGVVTDRVLVRDSKDRTAPALTFSATAWRAFLATLTP